MKEIFSRQKYQSKNQSKNYNSLNVIESLDKKNNFKISPITGAHLIADFKVIFCRLRTCR